MLNDAAATAVGTAISAAIDAMSQEQQADKEYLWQEVMKVIYSKIKADAQVINVQTTVTGSASGVTGTGPPGGPLPIVAQPVTGAGAQSGAGSLQ